MRVEIKKNMKQIKLSKIIPFFFLTFFSLAICGKNKRKTTQSLLIARRSSEESLNQYFFGWINKEIPVIKLKKLVEKTGKHIPEVLAELQTQKSQTNTEKQLLLFKTNEYKDLLDLYRKTPINNKEIFEELYLLLNFLQQLYECLENKDLCLKLNALENKQIDAFFAICQTNYKTNLLLLKNIFYFNEKNNEQDIDFFNFLAKEIEDFEIIQQSPSFIYFNKMYQEYFSQLRISNHIFKFFDLRSFSNHKKINAHYYTRKFLNETYVVFFLNTIFTILKNNKSDDSTKTEKINANLRFFQSLDIFQDHESAVDLLVKLIHIAKKLTDPEKNNSQELFNSIKKNSNHKEITDVIIKSYEFFSKSENYVFRIISYKIHDLYNLLRDENFSLKNNTFYSHFSKSCAPTKNQCLLTEETMEQNVAEFNSQGFDARKFSNNANKDSELNDLSYQSDGNNIDFNEVD